ncbi:zinc-dependent metalloprotease [Microbacterium stercoris]|uniref:Zinc-dependent metalloprotease n=1 Tax=Microbacterium stercoris TaxID=2820289 RepID=A0A939QGQ6_9MICO|nr:zinc-dependent metalloprotease [Microbacterium stercoris]MBO3662334.1 zinc-dependent metalloprotease [Microbacterium stercoris]MBO3664326.1 zinc-dependent metalloprotease [Microbacterium stercoris]
MADDDRSPEDEFQELMRQLFGATGSQFDPAQFARMDPEQLARLTGVPMDPATLSQVMQNLQSAFRNAPANGIDWDVTRRQALHIANQDGLSVTAGQRADLDQAFHLADLWLSEATAIADLAEAPRAITRGEWVEKTLPVWQELAEPVATSVADALTSALSQQVPEEMQGLVANAGQMMRGLGGSLFATQLGQVVGRLALEVVSGGDVGIPLLPAGEAAILPQNFADLGRGLEIPDDQLALYVAARELAHARLFRHAKWLRLHVLSQVTEYARGVHIDTERLEEMASRVDPSDLDELRQALESGALLPQQTEAQELALARLENMLALIEGWVDVVTSDATARIPQLDRIAEAIRRRRAVGGPAEDALSALVGLKLRPRRLREAAAMWRALTDAVGVEARDALWDSPDFVPEAEDIDDPSRLIARLEATARGEAPQRDEMDDALERLLAEGLNDEGLNDDPDAQGEAPEDDGPEGPKPV